MRALRSGAWADFPESKSLIRQLLSAEPSSRPSIDEILGHAWFKMTIRDLPEVNGTHQRSEQAAPTARETRNPSPRRLSPKQKPARPSPGSSNTSLDLTDSEHGPPASDSTAPTTVEDDELSRSIPRNHSGEFSKTEQALELLHANTSESTIKRRDSEGSSAGAGVKAKVAIKSSLEGLDEDSSTEHGDRPAPLPLQPQHLASLQHTRTPSRTKRRSASSSLSMERQASYRGSSGSSGDFDVSAQQDYLKHLGEERPTVFSTAREKELLDSFKTLGFDTEQLQHSVESNACDSSAAMWWILSNKNMSQVDEPNREIKQKVEAEAILPTVIPDVPTQIQSEDQPRIVTATPGRITPPNADQQRPLSPKTTPQASPFRGMKSRSPSLSMLQRATSAFTGRRDEKEDEPEKISDGRGSPTKLVKNPLKAKAMAGEQHHELAHATRSRFHEEEPTRHKNLKRDSLWTSFRYMFNEEKRRHRHLAASHAKLPEALGGPTVILARGPVARHQPGPLRTPQALPSSRRTSVEGRPPLYSRRSSSVNSRRSSATSSMLPSDHRETMNALVRRVSHRSHGSQTPTSEQEIEFPPRFDSVSHASRHQSSLRSPSMQSESSSRFHSTAPPSPLHDYHRRPPSGSSSSRVRHFRVIPEATVTRSGSVASSIRSTASSRASSIDQGRNVLADDASASSSARARREGKRRSPRPKVRHTRLSKPPLRDVFEDKDGEWVDEDGEGNERRAFAGGLGQGATAASAKARDSRASSHPGNWNAPGSRKRHHKHGHRSRKNSDEEFRDETALRDESGLYRRRTGLSSGRLRQPVIEEDEDEDM